MHTLLLYQHEYTCFKQCNVLCSFRYPPLIGVCLIRMQPTRARLWTTAIMKVSGIQLSIHYVESNSISDGLLQACTPPFCIWMCAPSLA